MSFIRLLLLTCVFSLFMYSSPQQSQAKDAIDLEWGWNEKEYKRIKSNATYVKKDKSGYWVRSLSGMSCRTNISPKLTIKGYYYLDHCIKNFQKVTGLQFTKKTTGHLALVIHDKAEDFRKAMPNAVGRVTNEVKLSSKNKMDITFHVLAGQKRKVGKLQTILPLSELQYSIASVFSSLCTGDGSPPEFLSFGMGAFFSGWDMRLSDNLKSDSKPVDYGNKAILLRNLIEKDNAFIPSIKKLVNLTEDDFNGDAGDTNLTLAMSFIDFITSRYGSAFRVQLKKLCKNIEKGGDESDFSKTLLNESNLKIMEKKWREHICFVSSHTMVAKQYEFQIEGSIESQRRLNRTWAYGHSPHVLLTPMKGGGYALVWFDKSEKRVRIMVCDEFNKKLYTISPESLKESTYMLGATYVEKNKTFIVVRAKKSTAAEGYNACWVDGVDTKGKKTFSHMFFGNKPKREMGSRGNPGGGGSGRVMYNESTGIVAFFSCNTMQCSDGNLHQGGYMGSIKYDGSQLARDHGWFFSHNFDQRMIVSGSSFFTLSHGDGYPRAMGVHRWDYAGIAPLASSKKTKKTKKKKYKPFQRKSKQKKETKKETEKNTGPKVMKVDRNIRKVAGTHYHNVDKEGGNNIHALTGGITELNGGKNFAISYSSSNGKRKGQDAAVTLIDRDCKVIRTRWLTEYDNMEWSATYPRIANFEGNVLVAYNECEKGAGVIMRLLLLSADIKKILLKRQYLNIQLPTSYDMVNLTDGTVAWAISSGGQIIVTRFNTYKKVEKDLNRILKERIEKKTSYKTNSK